MSDENNAGTQVSDAQSYRIDFVQQEKAFYHLAKGYLSPNAMALYMILFNINNNAFWAEWIEVTNDELQKDLSMKSLPTLQKVKRELIAKGFIKYESGYTNNPCRYSLVNLYEPASEAFRKTLKIAELKDRNSWLQYNCDRMKAENEAKIAKELSGVDAAHKTAEIPIPEEDAKKYTDIGIKNCTTSTIKNYTPSSAENYTYRDAKNDGQGVLETTNIKNNTKHIKQCEIKKNNKSIKGSPKAEPIDYTRLAYLDPKTGRRYDRICQWLSDSRSQPITDNDKKSILSMARTYPDDMVDAAIEKAKHYGAHVASYLSNILNSMVDEAYRKISRRPPDYTGQGSQPATHKPQFDYNDSDISFVRHMSFAIEEYTDDIAKEIRAKKEEMAELEGFDDEE